MAETNAADSFFSYTASRAISRNRPAKVCLYPLIRTSSFGAKFVAMLQAKA
jgi:hypothetical protein